MRCVVSPKEGKFDRYEWWNAMFEDEDLGAIARNVGSYLLNRANGDAEAWPSIATISERVRRSQNSVRSALDELEAGGWLRRVKRQHDKGWGYTFTLCTPSTTEPLQPLNPFTDCTPPLQPLKVTPSTSEGKQTREHTKEQTIHTLTRAGVPDLVVEVCREVDRETGGQKQLLPTEAEQLIEIGEAAEVVPVFVDKWRRYKSAAFYKLLGYTRDALERDRAASKPRNALQRPDDTLGREILEEMNATEIDHNGDLTNPELFAEWAEANPEKAAKHRSKQ